MGHRDQISADKRRVDDGVKNDGTNVSGICHISGDRVRVTSGVRAGHSARVIVHRKKYDHKLLESLAKGQKLVEPGAAVAAPVGAPRISIQWVLALGILLAMSILCNVLLYTSR